ncbi:MAG TPA: hypothetical protein VEQ63_00680 [Bryobacteraceae bacterium]|nr:hypothetical protein [Bryobacteraceae bacterium]
MEQNREDMYQTTGSPASVGQSESSYTGTTGTGTNQGGVIGSAKQMASGLMDQVTTQAQDKKQTMVSGLHSVADAFRQMSDDLTQRDNGPVAQYAAQLGRSLGSKADDFSRYMEGRHVRDIADDFHDFARRKPAVFLGGALLLGLAASRFFKSSRPSSSARFAGRDYDSFRMGPAGGGTGANASPFGENPSSSIQGSGQDWSSNQGLVAPLGTNPSFPEQPTQSSTYGSGQKTDDKLEL